MGTGRERMDLSGSDSRGLGNTHGNSHTTFSGDSCMSILVGSIGAIMIALAMDHGGISIDKKEWWFVFLGIGLYGIAQHI